MIDTLPEGWLTEAEADALAELARGKVVLEIGAWLGRSTVAMARTAALVVSVDHHRGSREHQDLAQGSEQYAPGLIDPKTGERSTLRRFVANVAPYSNIVPIVASFEQVAPYLQGFEMAFIDAAHDHDAVVRDALAADSCMYPGGPMAFHDFGAWPGVVSAVTQLQRHWKATLQVPKGTTLAVLRRG